MIDFLSDVCLEYIEAIDTHLSDGTGWFVFANYEQGRKTMPFFASLDAFYPGLLVRDFYISLCFLFSVDPFNLELKEKLFFEFRH